MVDIEKLRALVAHFDLTVFAEALDELERLQGIEEKAKAIPATCGGCSLADWGNWFNRYGPLMETLTEADMNELSDLFCALVDLAAALAKPADHSKEN